MLRLGDDGVLAALEEDHTRPFDFTGRVLKSFIYIEAAGFATDALLKAWVERAMTFVRSLPEK